MIKIENVVTPSSEQWRTIIMGTRNAMNSWGKSDSDYRPILCKKCDSCWSFENETWENCDECEVKKLTESHDGFMVGPNDHSLMMRLRNAGTDHRKFMRMITVYVDITAPLYWWKEADTYSVGVVKNSCSTMHKIHAKEFTLDDFSHEHLDYISKGYLLKLIDHLNYVREDFIDTKDKDKWWQMIQLLPSSYNQRRTIMMNYEVLANMYKSRKDHKLDEWREFCKWIEELTYSELITGIER